ncbi:MAG: TIGR03663 family protein [Opitutaceae bacterium]
MKSLGYQSGKRLPEVFAIVLLIVAASWLRFSGLTDKPLHNDEAVQGYKTGLLLETGDYRYDPEGHHGPSLYFLDLPIARVRGEKTLAGLSELSLRLLPALAGVATIVAVLLLAPAIGPANALLGAAFAALSPLQAYFSRHYIQEPLLALFALLAILALLAYARKPGTLPAAAFGLAAGLIHATKETCLILGLSLAIALIAEGLLDREATRSRLRVLFQDRHPFRDLLAALLCGTLVSFLFHSSFLEHPAGFIDAFRAYLHGAEQAALPEHQKPLLYYLGLLVGGPAAGRFWSESLILVLAGIGWVRTLTGPDRTIPAHHSLRLIGSASIVQLVVYSLIPYKTPWLLIVPGLGLCILAGSGAALILRVLGRQHALGIIGALGLALGLAHLGLQARRACGPYAADPRNPYAYVQTVTDILKAPLRIGALSEVAGRPLRIKVIGEEYWPLPWYLRMYPATGYWSTPPPDADADVVISTAGLDDRVEASLKDAYQAEFIGLRPGVVLILRTRMDLWQSYVKTVE